jgi:hypothetical protein
MLSVPMVVAGALILALQPEPTERVRVPYDQLPPGAKLGVRVETVRKKLPVVPIVVIVKDAASYIEAIARWDLERRFPVLIDDGSLNARENISRFVRAFRPERVVRWSAGTPSTDWNVKPEAVEQAVGRAWGLKAADAEGKPTPIDRAANLARWKALQLAPPGVIVARQTDPAWPAGLALAAGRGQPVIWVETSHFIDATYKPADAEKLLGAIQQGVEATGLTWKSLGDDIDAVTLTMNSPQTIENGKDPLATTDRVGRDAPASSRWAWCGQIMGFAPESSYRAMCALFLLPSSGWVFDGYPESEPWNQFDGKKAAGFLDQAGIKSTLFDTPAQGAREWRAAASRPIDAGLILVNSKGNRDFFDLEPGTCRLGDVPQLLRPTIVHFVHSWSAQYLGSRDTVASRWLEHGAYAYLGSTNEPFLQAFQPTPIVAARLASSFTLGASVRLDTAPAWKLTLLGDPLITIGPPAPRAPVTAAPAFDGATELSDAVGPLLKDERFQEAIDVLALLGRDADIATLVAALVKDKPSVVKGSLAERAFLPVFRSGKRAALIALASRMGFVKINEAQVRDGAWLAAYGPGTPERELLEVLRLNVRPEQAELDASMLAGWWTTVFSADGTGTMLEGVRDSMPNPSAKAEVERVIKKRPRGR